MIGNRPGTLIRDESGAIVQAFQLPASGNTTNIASAVGSAASAVLTAGVYCISTTIDCRIAAGATATANDYPLYAGTTDYLYINGTALAAFCAATGGIISATKM